MIHKYDDWEQMEYLKLYQKQKLEKEAARKKNRDDILNWIRKLIRKGNNNESK